MESSAKHDLLFRQAFSLPRTARQFLEAWLPSDFLRLVYWDTLEVIAVSGINPALTERHEDVLYRVQAGDFEAWFYLLLEHQSRPDRWMALRLLEYTVLIWQSYRRDHSEPGVHLPLVIPIVIYPGPGTWGTVKSLRELIHIPEEIRSWAESFAPNQGMCLIQLAQVPLHALAHGPFSRAVLRALQCTSTGEVDADQVRAILQEAFQEPGQVELRDHLMGLWTYLLQHFELKKEEIRQIVNESIPPEQRANYMTGAEVLKEIGREEGLQTGLQTGLKQGRKEGRQQGLKRGMQKGQILAAQQAVKEALELRFGPCEEAITNQIDRITDSARLRELFRLAIQCQTRQEFTAQLPSAL